MLPTYAKILNQSLPIINGDGKAPKLVSVMEKLYIQ